MAFSMADDLKITFKPPRTESVPPVTEVMHVGEKPFVMSGNTTGGTGGHQAAVEQRRNQPAGYSLLDIEEEAAGTLLLFDLMTRAELPFLNGTHRTAFAYLKSGLEKKKRDGKKAALLPEEMRALGEASDLIIGFIRDKERTTADSRYVGTSIETMVREFDQAAAGYGQAKGATIA